MNTFLTVMVICSLLIGASVLTYITAKKGIFRAFKNSLLEAKKDGKRVSVIVDGVRLSIDPKDLKVEVLTD